MEFRDHRIQFQKVTKLSAEEPIVLGRNVLIIRPEISRRDPSPDLIRSGETSRMSKIILSSEHRTSDVPSDNPLPIHSSNHTTR